MRLSISWEKYPLRSSSSHFTFLSLSFSDQRGVMRVCTSSKACYEAHVSSQVHMCLATHHEIWVGKALLYLRGQDWLWAVPHPKGSTPQGAPSGTSTRDALAGGGWVWVLPVGTVVRGSPTLTPAQDILLPQAVSPRLLQRSPPHGPSHPLLSGDWRGAHSSPVHIEMLSCLQAGGWKSGRSWEEPDS